MRILRARVVVFAWTADVGKVVIMVDLPALAATTDDELSGRGIAAVNLACAHALPGAEGLDSTGCCRKLDRFADLVRLATDRLLPKFRRSPEDYEHTEGRFRMLVAATVLQRNLGVRYDPSCMEGPYDATDSRTLFIHGLLDGAAGTCVSLPVLYVAVGRRLGYPLWLVETREHLFIRWDDDRNERFNVECTSTGFSPRTDEHYLKWPRAVTHEEAKRHGYLSNMSPRGELALFLQTRGSCLLDNLMIGPAMDAFACASKINPNCPNIQGHWAVATMMLRITERLKWNSVADCSALAPATFRQILMSCDVAIHESWERWALPRAKEALDRIYNIHHLRSMAGASAGRRAAARSAVFSVLATTGSFSDPLH